VTNEIIEFNQNYGFCPEQV